MKKEMIFKKVVAGIGSAALAMALSACAHHDAAKAEGYGQIRTEGAATSADNNTPVVGTAPAPKNAEGVSGTTTPAVISGPAAVDSDGRAYTSSAAGGNGNAANLGNNTNVNLIPKKSSSEVTVTQTPIESTTTTVVSNTPAPIEPMVTETPAPAPVIAETPAPAPTPVVETPMASSTVDETPATTSPEAPKHHRKMHKD
jgi:ribonuclease E